MREITEIPLNALVVYNFILTYKSQHDGNSPTVREIVAGAGISSTSVVYYYLRRLQECNMIVIDGPLGQSRNIVIPGARWLPPAEIPA